MKEECSARKGDWIWPWHLYQKYTSPNLGIDEVACVNCGKVKKLDYSWEMELERIKNEL